MKLRNTVTGVSVDVPASRAAELLGVGPLWEDVTKQTAGKGTTARKPSVKKSSARKELGEVAPTSTEGE